MQSGIDRQRPQRSRPAPKRPLPTRADLTEHLELAIVEAAHRRRRTDISQRAGGALPDRATSVQSTVATIMRRRTRS